MNLLELIDMGGIITLIESIQGLCQSLLNFFSQMFGWLGSGILIVIAVGIGIAIFLRIIGR